MCDLPKDFDPSAFVGACLEMISFGVGSIHLKFNVQAGAGPGERKEAEIISYTSVELCLVGKPEEIKVGAYADVSKLGALLNKDVTHASLVSSNGFSLEFGGYASLTVAAKGSVHESYSIFLPEQEGIYV